MDAALVLVAWLVVWLAGAVLVLAWRGTDDHDALGTPGAGSWIAGVGFLVGAFAITLWMRLLSLVGIPFGVISLTLPSLIVMGGAVVVARRQRQLVMPVARQAWSVVTGAGIAPPWRLAWRGLLLWLALRYTLLWVNVVEQPLYPWDAWIQWATKARVWFELRRVVPFVNVTQWLAANGGAYTDAAPGYPGTVSLWQVYSSTILGHWDDALMNIPWWCVAIALALLVYGYLRGAGFVRVAALAGASLVATLPLVNVHVALAGYADLPMAVYYCGAALATLRWIQDRSRFNAGVAVVLAAACPFIKTPGIVWLLTLAAPLVVAVSPRHGKRIALASAGAAVVVLLVLARSSPTIFSYHLHLDFAPPWEGLFDSLFLLASWNLLWYGAVATALLSGRQLMSRELAPFTMLIAAGLLFLFIVFAFTNAREWVETQTTVNRALLHLAPLMAVWMAVVFQRRYAVAADTETLTPAATVAAEDLAPAAHAVAQVAPAVPAATAKLALVATDAVDDSSPTPNTMKPIPETSDPVGVDQLRLTARKTAHADSERLWQILLQRVPGDPEALFGLGNAASARGDAASAAGCFEAALQASPGHFGVLNNLGLAYEKLGRLGDAEVMFRRAVEASPAGFAAIVNLAQNLYQQKRYFEASVFFDKLAAHTINEPSFNANRGVCLAHARRFDEAEKALELAARQAPDRVLIKRDLALVRTKQRRWPEVARLLDEVNAALPNDIATLSMLETARSHTADWRDPAVRTMLIDAVTGPGADALPPIDPFMFLTWTDDPAVHLAAARCWTRQTRELAPAPMQTARRRAAGEPLRIGFVSSDFFNHPVTRLLLGLVERLDPARFTMFAYSTRTHAASPLQRRLMARMAAVREVGRMGPVQQAQQVRDDHIDILADLNGYTSGHAYDLFTSRPAPLQINYLGYTGTLANPAFDCIVTDRVCIPDNERAWYTEQPLFIEPCYLPSDPSREEGMLLTLPARSGYGLPPGATVFGALGACYKITPALYEAWMRILHRVPESVLWLRAEAAPTDDNLRREAQRHGIVPDRLVFARHELLPSYFARFRLVDLMLDTYPFGSHTTVNDALFAGVPVVTLAGRSFASRASGSQLISAGLPELVATTMDQYEALAVDLASDKARRRAFAERLRPSRIPAPLFDMDRYAQSFADMLTNEWDRRFTALASAPAAAD